MLATYLSIVVWLSVCILMIRRANLVVLFFFFLSAS